MEESIPERVSESSVIIFSSCLNSSFHFHLLLVLSGGSGVAKASFKAEPATRLSAVEEPMFWVYSFSCPGPQSPGPVLGGWRRQQVHTGQRGVWDQYSCGPMTWRKCSSTLSSNYSEEIYLVDWVEVRKKRKRIMWKGHCSQVRQTFTGNLSCCAQCWWWMSWPDHPRYYKP